MPRFADVSIEAVRSYWDASPCNIRHSSQTLGSPAYFAEVEARKYFVEPHIPAFAEFARWRGKRVLEIGCGIGTDTVSFARAGASVTAVDLSERSLEIARRRVEVFGLAHHVAFHLANAEALSEVVRPAPYDLVYAFGVIHHTPNPRAVIEEIRRHFVSPASQLKIMVYNRHAWKVVAIVLTAGWGAFWRLEELVAQNSEAQTGCPVTYAYTRRSVRELLRGFVIEDARVDHIFPYRIADYVQYRYVKHWYFRILPTPVFRWLERRLGWHLCVTARPA